MNKGLFLLVITIMMGLSFMQISGQSGDRAQQILKEITVEQFEDPGFWYGSIPGDVGVIVLSTREGKPKELAEGEDARIEQDDKYNLPPGKYVLGVKVKFFKRSISTFSIHPVRPIPIEGISKRLSVWVIGRNFRHKLKIIVEDFFGQKHELTMGELTFRGWQKLSVTIPGHIVQHEHHYTSTAGLKVVGFKVDCNLVESYGTFYMYLDDLSAETDLFAEEYKDIDDIPDNW
ncbi:MAG: flagellar filament protein FlaA [Spirochaetales bacterium]|nr:flagellar filament protein FlaA [Spirochaetales bacterium]